MRASRLRLLAFLLASLTIPPALPAQQTGQGAAPRASARPAPPAVSDTGAAAVDTTRRVTELVGIEVIGIRSNALLRIPGSASVITSQSLRLQQPLSANEVLRRLPGVHLQEEEGAGMRANIGIRGLDPDRSRAVLVLEDGVPVALAPYGEPELYYSPPIDRMERVEVVKGSGSILFGPQTIGGVVNFVTADPPPVPQGRLQLQGGTGGAIAARGLYGGTWGSMRGALGVTRRQAADLNGLDYHLTDITGKAGVRGALGDFGLKLSAYDERSNATYVGLTDSLFRHAPGVHPRPDDALHVRRYALTGSHELLLGGASSLRTSIYGYQTRRDWERRDYIYNETGNGHVFAPATGERNRSFSVIGIEPRLRTAWSAGGMRSDLDAGVRAHHEHARDRYLTGNIETGVRTLRDDEVRDGVALAAFVQNRFFLSDAIQVTPGIRVEHFTFDRHVLWGRVRRVDEHGTVTRTPEAMDVRKRDVVREVIPGIGATWAPIAPVTLFAGAHRGFAPPRTKDALIYPDSVRAMDQQVPDLISLQLDAERSWNYEIGARIAPLSALSVEATAFLLDFSNQIIQPSASAGTPAHVRLANQGETEHRGVEAALMLDVGTLLRRPWSLAGSVNYTLVSSRFSNDRLMVRAAGDTVNVKGNRLPYAPRQLVNAALTFDHPLSGLMIRLDGSWVAEQFADNFETRQGLANGRIGVIPAFHVADVSLRYLLPRLSDATLIASVKNVTGETYIASRRPEGIRTGLPRLMMAGVSWEW